MGQERQNPNSENCAADELRRPLDCNPDACRMNALHLLILGAYFALVLRISPLAGYITMVSKELIENLIGTKSRGRSGQDSL